MASKGCRVEWLEKTENEDSDSWLRESAYRLGMSWQVNVQYAAADMRGVNTYSKYLSTYTVTIRCYILTNDTLRNILIHYARCMLQGKG